MVSARLMSRRGMTLPEVMMTVAIVAILGSVSAPLLKNMNNFWLQTKARNDIQRDVRVSLDLINRFLRQARQNTVQIDQVSGQPPYSRITFTTLDSENITFWQSGKDLSMSVSSGAATSSRVISSNVGYIAFTYPRTDDISIISVALTMQSATYLGQKKALQLSIQKVRVMNP